MGLDIVDAKNIAPGVSQTVSADNFIIQHQNKPLVNLTVEGFGVTLTSDGTTPIAAGVTIGQLLTIKVISLWLNNHFVLQAAGNCVFLQGDWKVDHEELTLIVQWDGSQWREVIRNRHNGCDMSGTLASASGSGSDATAPYAHARGLNCTASGAGSCAEGNGCTASGDYSHAQGANNDAGGDYSHAQGYGAVADQDGELVQANKRVHSDGDAQRRVFVCSRELTPDSGGDVIGMAGSAIGPVIPVSTVWNFRAEIVGCHDNAGAGCAAVIEGCIKRDNGGTVSSLTINATSVIHADDADIVFTAEADDTNKSLNIVVTDATDGSDEYIFVVTIFVTQATKGAPPPP